MFVVLLNNHTRILAPIYFGFVNSSERLIKTNNIYIYIYMYIYFFFFHFILSKIIVYVTSFIDIIIFGSFNYFC